MVATDAKTCSTTVFPLLVKVEREMVNGESPRLIAPVNSTVNKLLFTSERGGGSAMEVIDKN